MLETVSKFILYPFRESTTMKLIIVICIIPVIMNGL